MKKFGVTGMMLLSLLALAACGSDGDKKAKADESADKPKKEEIKTDDLICPQVAILQEAQDIQDYGGEKPDPAQAVAAAHMVKIDGDCAYHKDEKKKAKNGIDISFTLHLDAWRGPRLGGNDTSFPYFVALVDPSENILSRQILTAHFTFSGADKKTADEEKLHIFIPLSAEEMQAGPDYRVLVGFKNAKPNTP